MLTDVKSLLMDVNNTVLEELKTKPPFMVWMEQWDRMKSEMGGDIAMVRLLKLAESDYSEENQSLDQMALMIKVEARHDLDVLEQSRYAARETGDRIDYGEVDKPMQIYHRWMKPLRFIQKFNYEVSDILMDLQMEQTLPFGELDAPDEVDQYTGEYDPTARLERVYFQAPERLETVFNIDSVRVYAKRLTELASVFTPAKEWAYQTFENYLKMSGEFDDLQLCLIRTFDNEIAHYQRLLHAEAETLKYSEGFDQADGLSDVDFEYDDQDTRIAPFMEFQEDMRMQNYFDLRYEASSVIEDLKDWMSQASKTISIRREQMYRRLKKHFAIYVHPELLTQVVNDLLDDGKLELSQTLMEERSHRSAVFAAKKYIWNGIKDMVRGSHAAEEYLEILQDFLDRGEHIPDVVLLFASFQNGLCFSDEDADQLIVRSLGISLYEYMEINGDEILENFNDPNGIRDTSPSWQFIQQYSEEVIDEYAKTGVPYHKQDRRKFKAHNEPNFIKGMLKAASNMKDVSPSKLVSAGYEYMRQQVSPKGNRVYHQLIQDGMAQKDAMREFHKIASSEERITSVRPTGLVLNTGRVVDFGIAKLKVQHNEIVFEEGDRDRLKKLLASKGWGQKLVDIL